MGRTILGCDRFIQDPPGWLFKARTGILCHQASVTSKLTSLPEELIKRGAKVTCLFSPQHGFFSEKQANMIESEDFMHPLFKIPVFSLYGQHRVPTKAMINNIDVLIVDLQDVGTRVYTYPTTMGLFLEALSGLDIKVVVLDRPNPITGFYVEGNVVEEEFKSFVGRYSLPMRHGLTIGEYAKWIVKEKKLDVELDVVEMIYWHPSYFFEDTGIPWVFPSPNMPTVETALLYPGMVLLEGTNISEGRGTTLPFSIFGAPFLDPYKFLKELRANVRNKSVLFRPIFFEPTYDKWKNQTCGGFQIHIVERKSLKPFSLALEILKLLLKLYPEDFRWLNPPYEYEMEKLPIDILLGSGKLRLALETADNIEEIEEEWSSSLVQFLELKEDIKIYR